MGPGVGIGTNGTSGGAMNCGGPGSIRLNGSLGEVRGAGSSSALHTGDPTGTPLLSSPSSSQLQLSFPGVMSYFGDPSMSPIIVLNKFLLQLCTPAPRCAHIAVQIRYSPGSHSRVRKPGGIRRRGIRPDGSITAVGIFIEYMYGLEPPYHRTGSVCR